MLLIQVALFLVLPIYASQSFTHESRDELTYAMTPEEIQAFIAVKRTVNPTYQPFSKRAMKQSPASNLTFEQSKPADKRIRKRPNRPKYRYHLQGQKYPSMGSLDADCTFHTPTWENYKKYSFTKQRAKCLAPVESPEYTVWCPSTYTVGRLQDRDWPGRVWEFTHVCPPPEVCMDSDYSGTALEGTDATEVFCAHPEDIRVKHHAAVAIAKKRRTSSMYLDWCGPTEHIPGFDYPSTYQTTSFLTTMEVSWANGSEYLAPTLVIMDSPSIHKAGFDRAYKHNSDLVSSVIDIGSVRGKLQSRAIDFCMDMLAGGDVWAVMMYTWIKVKRPMHGKIPSPLESVPADAYEDTTY